MDRKHTAVCLVGSKHLESPDLFRMKHFDLYLTKVQKGVG
jgi:hypothetical protein